jgi:hypothetical protein
VLDAQDNLLQSTLAAYTITATLQTTTSNASAKIIAAAAMALYGTRLQRTLRAMAVFTDLSVGAAGEYIMVFAQLGGGLSPVYSPSFAIVCGPAARLTFRSKPGGAIPGAPLKFQPALQAQDAGGNVVQDASPLVTVTLRSLGVDLAVSLLFNVSDSDGGPAGSGWGEACVAGDNGVLCTAPSRSARTKGRDGLAVFEGLQVDVAGCCFTLLFERRDSPPLLTRSFGLRNRHRFSCFKGIFRN